jgi:hypothetical protein
MTIASITAVSFVLGASVAYVANRYPGHREIVDAVGGTVLIGWALLSGLFVGRGSGGRVRSGRCHPETSGVMRSTAAPPGRC